MTARDLTASLATGPDQPVLVFGGPYSNLRATTALRREAERLAIPPERTICTGDVVAYCAEPEETARAMMAWGCHVIAGNCEEQIAAGASDCGCGFEAGTACDLLAKGWYPFAKVRMSRKSRAWMGGLPKALVFELAGLRYRVLHGGVDVINRFVFASQKDVLVEELRRADADVVIAGHAGVPFAARVPGGPGGHGGGVWFNPGVIGMPANDGTADVWYGLVKPGREETQLSLHRLKYDHPGAAAAMRRHAYADGYARAIVTGVWPSGDIFPEVEAAATGRRLRPRLMTVTQRRRYKQQAAE